MATRAALLLLACVAGLRAPRYSLRGPPPSSCGFAHHGSAVGSAQRLVETQLPPGVADWNIVVPMPPPCAQTQVTGADMYVCDSDAPPDVSMSDVHSARVHRPGQLAGFATVNVTVYCILPPPHLTLPADTGIARAVPLSYLTDRTSTYEMLSNELSSNKASTNEETSYESESVDLTSDELTTTVKPTSSKTLPTTEKETTVQVEPTLSTEVVTTSPLETIHPEENIPHSLKVTINITPNSQEPTEEDVSYDSVELPLLSTKEKLNEVLLSQSTLVPYIMTPPRFGATSPQGYDKTPRGPKTLAQQYQPRAHRPRAHRPRAHRPRVHRPRVHQPQDYRPPSAPRRPRFPLAAQYAVAYRPLSLLGPRLRFLQRRQPLWFLHHF